MGYGPPPRHPSSNSGCGSTMMRILIVLGLLAVITGGACTTCVCAGMGGKRPTRSYRR
jgi:hypothetical protein